MASKYAAKRIVELKLRHKLELAEAVEFGARMKVVDIALTFDEKLLPPALRVAISNLRETMICREQAEAALAKDAPGCDTA